MRRSDICVWCGHPGSRASNHRIPVEIRPDLAFDPDNAEPIHGTERCPTCGRACNSEVGARIIGVDIMPPTAGSRDW